MKLLIKIFTKRQEAICIWSATVIENCVFLFFLRNIYVILKYIHTYILYLVKIARTRSLRDTLTKVINKAIYSYIGIQVSNSVHNVFLDWVYIEKKLFFVRLHSTKYCCSILRSNYLFDRHHWLTYWSKNMLKMVMKYLNKINNAKFLILSWVIDTCHSIISHFNQITVVQKWMSAKLLLKSLSWYRHSQSLLIEYNQSIESVV